MPGGYEGFGDYAAPTPAPAGSGYEAFGDYQEPAPRAAREVSRSEALKRGIGEGVSFGAGPAGQGLAAAGEGAQPLGAPEKRFFPDAGYASGQSALKPIEGALRMAREYFSGSEAKPATEAYKAKRDTEREANEQAFEQHPGYYVGGQVGGALLTPLGAVKGETLAARVGSAAKSGVVAGALGGAGTAISAGAGPFETLVEAGKGAALGGVVGGAGGAAIEGGAKVAGRAGDIIRGITKTEEQAGRGVRGAATADVATGRPGGLDPEAELAAMRAGLPVLNIDRGGEVTRTLGRTAGNVSPEAWGALAQATGERTENRPQRISDTINRLFGGNLDSKLEQDALERQAQQANAPRYARAYAAGDRPIWSPEIERLVSVSPTVRQAMKSAITTGQDRAAVEGFGGFNPPVKVTPDGRLAFNRTSSGAPVYPNMQYWDYVQRDLNDMYKKIADREPDKASAINGLHQLLNTELDRLVPEFQDARVGAWRFFQSRDAAEAGRKFVRMDADPREGQRALAQMTKPDQEIFARNFADELRQMVTRNPNTLNTIKRLFTSPNAVDKIRVGMGGGPQGGPRVRELEALLRAETVAHKSQEALGNSTTARQQEMIRAFKATGLAHGAGGFGAGAGAIGALEFLKDGDFDPKSILGTALVVGLLRGGAHKVDTRVMKRIGEMLASDNPAIMRQGVAAVAHTPKLMDALRRGTEAGTRIGARDIGPDRALAGSAAILSDILAHEEEMHHASHPDNQQLAPPQ